MLRRLVDRLRRRQDDEPAEVSADRDYAQEREDYRDARMSDEDKAWGAASQQRDRERRAGDEAPPVP